MERRLALRRETLADLSPEDLSGVAGAASGETCIPAVCAAVSVLTTCAAYCPHTFPGCD
jgi:hypothetical protein